MWSQLLSSIALMLWEGGVVGTCPPRGQSRFPEGQERWKKCRDPNSLYLGPTTSWQWA